MFKRKYKTVKANPYIKEHVEELGRAFQKINKLEVMQKNTVDSLYIFIDDIASAMLNGDLSLKNQNDHTPLIEFLSEVRQLLQIISNCSASTIIPC